MEFKERLKKLMEENGIKTPEELSIKLEQLHNNSSIHSNTIRNYLKGTTPKDFQKFKILADYFNVSTDYIQGFTDTKTPNIDIKNISEKYGLSENALKNLEFLNNRYKNLKKPFNDIGAPITYINTINKLLEEFTPQNHNEALLSYIDLFLNIEINKNLFINISTHGEMNVINVSKTHYGGLAIINNEAVINGLLTYINNKLIELRKELKKDGENK